MKSADAVRRGAAIIGHQREKDTEVDEVLRLWLDQDLDRIHAICARLTCEGVVEPLAERADDVRAWHGWELA